MLPHEIHTHVKKHVSGLTHTHSHVEARGHAPVVNFQGRVSLGLGSCQLGEADWPASPRDLLPSAGSKAVIWAFLCEFWGSHLGPQCCTVSALPIEPSPDSIPSRKGTSRWES